MTTGCPCIVSELWPATCSLLQIKTFLLRDLEGVHLKSVALDLDNVPQMIIYDSNSLPIEIKLIDNVGCGLVEVSSER